MTTILFLQEEDKQRRDDKLEKRYTLPEHPAIIVHPHATAKSGKFDCTVMSLSVLLDYRPEDNKEHSFEVNQGTVKVKSRLDKGVVFTRVNIGCTILDG